MAHQCLKCGRSYPDGSPQILKGCEGCQGTRFFYTEKPIGAREREELQARTEDELGRAGEGLPRRDRRIPTKGELPVGEDRDWVSMGPGNLRNIVEDVVRRAHEKKPTFRVTSGGERPPSLEEWVRQREQEAQKEQGDDDEDPVEVKEVEQEGSQDPGPDPAKGPWPPWPQQRPGDARPAAGEGPSETTADNEKSDVVYRRRGESRLPVEPEPEVSQPSGPAKGLEDAAPNPGLGGPSDAQGTVDAEEGEDEDGPSLPIGRPETVEVLEQGVYDLDVERLLEKNPIVVHKDGSYSLHLPSLMETLEKKRR